MRRLLFGSEQGRDLDDLRGKQSILLDDAVPYGIGLGEQELGIQIKQRGPGIDLMDHVHEGSDKLCLESYIESKLSEFVKGMKSSAGRNLHPMLISAVERPLITFALKETNGNQIQAAHLLGMNRNTLRKKISELRIPIKREKPAKA